MCIRDSIGWVKYFKQRPHIIWESRRKRFYEDKGHIIFAQQKTTDSHCLDPMLSYIKSLAADVFYNKEEKKLSLIHIYGFGYETLS